MTYTRFFVPMCLMAGLLPAGETKADAAKAVAATEKEWVQCVMKADRAGLEKRVAEDLMYIHSSGKVETKAEFLEAVSSGKTTYTKLEFSGEKMRQFGSTVVVTHTADIVTVQTGAAHLFLTEVWAPKGAQWQMVSRQATKLP